MPPIATKSAASREAVLPPGTRVLFADDVEINRKVVGRLLEDAGCAVDLVADGAQAVARAQTETYDLVLLDLRMPVMDGFEAARRIRGLASGRHIPLVALTTSTGSAERRLANECGFDDFLGKPVDGPVLLAALAERLPGAAPPADHGAPPQPGAAPQFPGIPAGLEHLLPLFLAEMAKDGRRLTELVANTIDTRDLADHAHAMRGKCAMFGEERLFLVLGTLEEQAATAGVDEIAGLVEQIIARVGQLALYDPQRYSLGLPIPS